MNKIITIQGNTKSNNTRMARVTIQLQENASI